MESYLEKIVRKTGTDYRPSLIYPGDSASAQSNSILDISTRYVNVNNYTTIHLPIEQKSGKSKLINTALDIPLETMFTKSSQNDSLSIELFMRIDGQPSKTESQIVKINNETNDGIFIKGQHISFKICSGTKKIEIIHTLDKIDKPMNIIISQTPSDTGSEIVFTINGKSKKATISSFSTVSQSDNKISINPTSDYKIHIGGIYFYNYAINTGFSDSQQNNIGVIHHYKYSFPDAALFDTNLFSRHSPILFSTALSYVNQDNKFTKRIDAGSQNSWDSIFPKNKRANYGTQETINGISVLSNPTIKSFSVNDTRLADPVSLSFSPISNLVTGEYSLGFGNFLYSGPFKNPFLINGKARTAFEIFLSIRECPTVQTKDLISFFYSTANESDILSFVTSRVNIYSKRSTNTTSDITYSILNSDGDEKESGTLISGANNDSIRIGFGRDKTTGSVTLYYKNSANAVTEKTFAQVTSSAFLTSMNCFIIGNNFSITKDGSIDTTSSIKFHSTSTDALPNPTHTTAPIGIKRILIGELSDLKNNSHTDNFNSFTYSYKYDTVTSSYRWIEDVYNASISYGTNVSLYDLQNNLKIYNNKIENGSPDIYDINNSSSMGFYSILELLGANLSVESTQIIKSDSQFNSIVKTWTEQELNDRQIRFFSKLDFYSDVRYTKPLLKYFRFFVNKNEYISDSTNDNGTSGPYKLFLSKDAVPPDVFGGIAPFTNSLRSGIIFASVNTACAIFKLDDAALPISSSYNNNQIATISFFMSSPPSNRPQRDIVSIYDKGGTKYRILWSEIISGNHFLKTDTTYVDRIYVNGSSMTFTVDAPGVKLDLSANIPYNIYSWNHFSIVMKEAYRLTSSIQPNGAIGNAVSWNPDPASIVFGGAVTTGLSSACMTYMDEIMLFPGRLNQSEASNIFFAYSSIKTVSPQIDSASTYGRTGITSASPSVINVLDKETKHRDKTNLQLYTNGAIKDVLFATDTFELPSWVTDGPGNQQQAAAFADKHLVSRMKKNSNPIETDYCFDSLFLGDLSLEQDGVYGILLLPPLTSSGYYRFKVQGSGQQQEIVFEQPDGTFGYGSPTASAINNAASFFWAASGTYKERYITIEKNSSGKIFFNDNPEVYKIKIYKDLP